uniref:Uncharacterized protein n=1 Tax=Anguilla anguilla TaxID=7936 RepID=A0A0E9XL56_ANGAN
MSPNVSSTVQHKHPQRKRGRAPPLSH